MKVFQISFRIFVVQKAKLYQNKIDKGINIAIFSICPAKMLSWQHWYCIPVKKTN